ncbi:hypothetical protein KNP414_05045 [Paenibacillus mucilaginosus KNP414]|uniref:Uncharacterized protein n=1 Tax=Paenibacillus mucilaginosus (strain KNP414) TaxID=1036673 RepID=F8F6Q3_PAEMK|nr:hypothetical protein KNP414_05045 [Paenibacillus mucilaginosus KNP414]
MVSIVYHKFHNKVNVHFERIVPQENRQKSLFAVHFFTGSSDIRQR